MFYYLHYTCVLLSLNHQHCFTYVFDVILMYCLLQLRPPQPAVYLFVLDVSFNAVETGKQFYC